MTMIVNGLQRHFGIGVKKIFIKMCDWLQRPKYLLTCF